MTDTRDDTAPPEDDDAQGLACVLVFNANDPSGAGGLTGDVLAMGSVGAHTLPVVTGSYAPNPSFDLPYSIDTVDRQQIADGQKDGVGIEF